MNYALIEGGQVINLIYLHPTNAKEFPNAVPFDNIPVEIGDCYDGEKFYRNGEEITIASHGTNTDASYNNGYDQAILDLIAQGVL